MSIAKRISLMEEIDLQSICYWKSVPSGQWMLYLPGVGVGDLSEHTVTEHEDGTITVQPSILVTTTKHGKEITRHGFLERGVWRDV